MKKVYCKDCKWFKGCVFNNLTICSNPTIRGTIDEDKWKLGILNKNNDCKYFKIKKSIIKRLIVWLETKMKKVE